MYFLQKSLYKALLRSYYFIFLIKRDCYYIYRQSPYAFEPLPLKSEFRTAMLLDPNETANWIPYVIPLGPTTESHIIRYLFPERSLGRVPVDLAFATTMHLPFNESIFPENSGICALLFYAVDHPCILAAVSNIQFGSIACTEYSNHYSISVSHYNSFSIYRNSFSTHSNIFDDRESELYVSFISKRSNVSVWERVTILYRLEQEQYLKFCTS